MFPFLNTQHIDGEDYYFNMDSELPSVPELKRAVESGHRITAEDASYIAQREAELTGGGPVTGGPAGT